MSVKILPGEGKILEHSQSTIFSLRLKILITQGKKILKGLSLVEDIGELFSQLKIFRLLNFHRMSVKILPGEGEILKHATSTFFS